MKSFRCPVELALQEGGERSRTGVYPARPTKPENEIMKRAWTLLMIVGTILLLNSAATADWNPGDGHKMHFPQLPDPDGWDVNFMEPKVLADDWGCTETGPVRNIHFWFSSMLDMPFVLEQIHVSIHDDDRSDPAIPSRPGDLLWERDFFPGEFVYRPDGTGDQGWLDPNTGFFQPSDHFQTWQANITDIPDPFIQQVGTIYWLDLSVVAFGTGELGFAELGWKTSLQHWEDDAVWSDFGGASGWQELLDPITGESLDMAFVIAPEPGTIIMLAGVGLMGLAAFVRCRSKRKA